MAFRPLSFGQNTGLRPAERFSHSTNLVRRTLRARLAAGRFGALQGETLGLASVGRLFSTQGAFSTRIFGVGSARNRLKAPILSVVIAHVDLIIYENSCSIPRVFVRNFSGKPALLRFSQKLFCGGDADSRASQLNALQNHFQRAHSSGGFKSDCRIAMIAH